MYRVHDNKATDTLPIALLTTTLPNESEVTALVLIFCNPIKSTNLALKSLVFAFNAKLLFNVEPELSENSRKRENNEKIHWK